jgi:hypothetical protein
MKKRTRTMMINLTQAAAASKKQRSTGSTESEDSSSQDSGDDDALAELKSRASALVASWKELGDKIKAVFAKL